MFTYYARQDKLIDDEGMVEVSYMAYKRQGSKAVIAYEYYKTLAGAQRRANTLAQEYGRALVNDFAGHCMPVVK